MKRRLETSELIFKIISYPSDDYPGYRYIKIYNKNATVENMTDYLKEKYGFDQEIFVGDDKELTETESNKRNCNEVIHQLNSLYYWGPKKMN